MSPRFDVDLVDDRLDIGTLGHLVDVDRSDDAGATSLATDWTISVAPSTNESISPPPLPSSAAALASCHYHRHPGLAEAGALR